MPAPAVYILAVVGTVGAVFAFKEFVYEPHIAPAIERWKAEYEAKQAEKRRRQGVPVEVPMSERRRSKKKDGEKFSDDEDDEDNDGGPSTWRSKFMRDGLLIRRRDPDAQPGRDVELESLVASEVSEWRNEITSRTGQDIRQRKNASLLGENDHSMDESIHTISYPTLSPTQAPHHVLFDSSMNSPVSTTPSSHASRLPSVPSSPGPGTMHTGALHPGSDLVTSVTSKLNGVEEPQPPSPPLSPYAPSSVLTSSFTSISTSPSAPQPRADSRKTTPSPPPAFASSVRLTPSPPPPKATPPLSPTPSTLSPRLLSSPPLLIDNATKGPAAKEFTLPTPASTPQVLNQQDVLSPLQLSVLPLSPSDRVDSPNVTPTSPGAPIRFIVSPLPVPSPSLPHDPRQGPDVSSTPTSHQFHHQSYPIQQPIPSLSQSYPQELDYEHGLELLSPPSLRADSPFSMADYSPIANFRAFSPLNANTNVRPESSLSRLSSVSASTSPFSTTMSSPELTQSPMRMGLGNESFDTLSPVMQARAFSGPGAADMTVPSPFADPVDSPRSLRAATGASQSQTSSARSTTYLSLSGSDDEDFVDAGRSEPVSPTDHGLGLTLRPVAHPRGRNDAQSHAQSDSELSDLDFLSDAVGAESEAESEEGWSVAGGSEDGQARSNPNRGAEVDRNATIRARGGPFGWRR